MAGQFVKNGATLKCPLCSSNGKLVVSHTEVQLQDTPFATNGDRSKSNLVFGGVCNKWRKNKPLCASVISPTQWNGVASDLEIDGEFMLLDNSTISCTTGGVDIEIADTVQMDVPTDLPEMENAILKKFLVNVRRPEDYKGEYGFDWLRDEYIYPIETIMYDTIGSDGFPETAPLLNQKLPVCKNFEDLKNEYKTIDVVNPITPYGVAYYPAWLSIFSDVSQGYLNQVDLNIEIEEIEPLENDATQIIFESANDSLIVTPSEISLSELLGEKQTKDLGTKTKSFYITEKVINIKCEGNILENHEEIKIYAELDGEKEEVGKLMVYKNDQIPKAEIIAINIKYGQSASLSPDYQNAIRNQSFNQALVDASVIRSEVFDIDNLDDSDQDVIHFKEEFNNPTRNIDHYENFDNEEKFMNKLIHLYEKYGENAPSSGKIDGNLNMRTYLFYTSITSILYEQEGTYPRVETKGRVTLHEHEYTPIVWGNIAFIFGGALTSNFTVIHELGHSLSLPHPFHSRAIDTPFTFYQGFTDNYMDYNKLHHPDFLHVEREESKFSGNMYSFFKWQWDILRKDRSLVYENNSLK